MTSSVAELNCGFVAFCCVPLLLPTVEHFSTFREATNASANQIAFHANTAAQALAYQIAFMLMFKASKAKRKMADQMVVFVHESCLFDFVLLRLKNRNR